jgi:integrase
LGQGSKSYVTKCDRIRLLLDDDKAFGKYNLGDFTVEAAETYMSRRIAEGRNTCHHKPCDSVLKHMLGKAVLWEKVSEEKIKKVLKVKLLEEHNIRTRFLSKEECRLLLETCPAYLKPIVQTALSTGMRKDEILSLTLDKVDFIHNQIVLVWTKNGENRHIPINGALRSVFEGLAATNVDGHRYVFHDQHGQRYQDVKRGFPRACKRAGITNLTFHDLRHTFASHLVMAGVDITTVSKLLGHKDLTMTLRYAHLAPGHLSKAISVVEVLLNEKSPMIASA